MAGSPQRVVKMSGNRVRTDTSDQAYRFRLARVKDVLVENVGVRQKCCERRSHAFLQLRGEQGGARWVSWSAASRDKLRELAQRLNVRHLVNLLGCAAPQRDLGPRLASSHQSSPRISHLTRHRCCLPIAPNWN